MRSYLSSIVLAFVVAGHIGFWLRDPQPISLIGVALCGRPVAGVVVMSDGTQKRFATNELNAMLPYFEQVPKKNAGILQMGGKFCEVLKEY